MAKIPAHIKKQIKAYIKAAEKKWDISLVILFGSYAKGKARKDSDIDLAIVSKKFSSPPSLKTLQIMQELKWGIAPDIEPIAVDAKSFKAASKFDFIGGVVCRDGIQTYKNKKFLI